MARGYTEKMLGCGAPEEVVLKPNFSALKDRRAMAALLILITFPALTARGTSWYHISETAPLL